jgi:NAD(P)H-dependent FMN reductase
MLHTPPSLLIFAGSTRQHSFNRKLAHATADIAREAGAAVTLLELSDFDIPLYNADLEAQGTPADVIRLKEILWQHPAWVICSPEYNGSYTALLKNTIDWASSPVNGHPDWQDGTKPFHGKVVGMLSASPGGLGGLAHSVPAFEGDEKAWALNTHWTSLPITGIRDGFYPQRCPPLR